MGGKPKQKIMNGVCRGCLCGVLSNYLLSLVVCVSWLLRCFSPFFLFFFLSSLSRNACGACFLDIFYGDKNINQISLFLSPDNGIICKG